MDLLQITGAQYILETFFSVMFWVGDGCIRVFEKISKAETTSIDNIPDISPLQYSLVATWLMLCFTSGIDLIYQILSGNNGITPLLFLIALAINTYLVAHLPYPSQKDAPLKPRSEKERVWQEPLEKVNKFLGICNQEGYNRYSKSQLREYFRQWYGMNSINYERHYRYLKECAGDDTYQKNRFVQEGWQEQFYCFKIFLKVCGYDH